MTKVGSGKHRSEEPKPEKYHKDLHQSALKFLKTLDQFQDGSEMQREHFKAVMDQELLLMEAAVREINRPGMHKQYVAMKNSYETFIKDPIDASPLTHDVYTLRDFNKL